MTNAQQVGLVYMVGSMPGTMEENLRQQFEMYKQIGYHGPITVVHGEVGRQWIAELIIRLRDSGMVHNRSRWIFSRGDFSGYRHLTLLTPRKNVKVDPDWGFAREAAEAYPIARKLAAEYGFEQVRLVQGVGSVFNVLLFTLGLWSRREEITKSLLKEAQRILEVTEGNAILQFEEPAPTVLTCFMPLGSLRHLVADRLMRREMKDVARLPKGTDYLLHFCDGDLGGKSLARFLTMSVVVTLANAAVRHRPANRQLLGIHGPAPMTSQGPRRSQRAYRPLRWLRTQGIPFSVGYVHHAATITQLHKVRELIERNCAQAGLVPLMVPHASPCGLGRQKKQSTFKRYLSSFTALAKRTMHDSVDRKVSSL